jgi:hypothetical protein
VVVFLPQGTQRARKGRKETTTLTRFMVKYLQFESLIDISPRGNFCNQYRILINVGKQDTSIADSQTKQFCVPLQFFHVASGYSIDALPNTLLGRRIQFFDCFYGLFCVLNFLYTGYCIKFCTILYRLLSKDCAKQKPKVKHSAGGEKLYGIYCQRGQMTYFLFASFAVKFYRKGRKGDAKFAMRKNDQFVPVYGISSGNPSL